MTPVLLMTAAVLPLLSPGQPLPVLKGEFLTGRPAVLPGAASGRVALMALGFSYESRFAVEKWIGRFRAQFGNQPDVTFYEIPMIGGMARLGKWFIDSGMRKGTPLQDREHVITVYGGTDPWKQRLAYRSGDAAYLILLDQRGVVRWLHAGDFTDADYAALALQASTLLEKPSGSQPPVK
jgi:hypothetical protein